VSRFAFGLLAPAAVSAWSPLSFGSDLLGWWDAQDGATITQSGGNVSQWADKSGSGNHLVQATGAKQPAYDATGFDGSRPAITQRDQAKGLENTSFVIGSAAVTFIALINIDTDTPFAHAGRIFSLAPSGQADYGHPQAMLPMYAGASNTVGAFYNSSLGASCTVSYGAKHWLISEWDGANHNMYVDGVFVSSTAAVLPTLNATTILRLLNFSNTPAEDAGLYGRLGEALVLKRALTTQDRTDLAAYMARWGL
jgi:hypothetical protein